MIADVPQLKVVAVGLAAINRDRIFPALWVKPGHLA